MLEILLGQVPEAIYFALFMIFTKRIKEKRLLFITLMIVEYLLLKQVLHYNIWFQVLYTFISYVVMKLIYKESSQITDIFTMGIGSLALILSSALFSLPRMIFYFDYTICVVLNRIALFLLLFVLRKKLYKIQNLYKKFWNRNDEIKKKMKSTTFRAINVVAFNLIFYIINLGMLCCIATK